MGKDERTRKRRRRGGHQAEDEEDEEEDDEFVEGEDLVEEDDERLRLRRHSNHKHKLKLVLKLPRSYAATNTTTTTATNSSSSSIPTTSLAPRGGGAGGLLSDTLSSPNPRRRERKPEEGDGHVTVGHYRKAPAPPRALNDEDDDDEEDGESAPKKKKRNINVVVSTATANGSRPHAEEDASAGSPALRTLSSFKAEKQNQCPEVTDSVPGTSSGPVSKTPMPDKNLIEFILDKLQKKDTYGVFSEPVDPGELPDYHEVIQHPMDFGTIRKKLAKGVYAGLEELENDVILVCTNAMHYNASDTIYHKQARAIQELAKKKFQMIKLNPEGIEAELRIALKTKPGYSSRKTRRPGPGRPPFEPTGSDFSSGATLATAGDHTNWSNASLQDSRTKRAPTAERPVNTSGYLDPSGKLFQGSRSGDALGPLIESKAEKSEEISASVLKAPAWRNGRRSLQLDENRRATYKPFNQMENGYDAIFSILDGESKQLFPIGIRSEYAYTRSLARFAANAGPLAWKIAAQRIQRALPPNVPFGPGWVGDSEAPAQSSLLEQGKSTAVSTSSATLPNVLGENKIKSNTCNDTPIINDGGHSKNLISECRSVSSAMQESSVRRLVPNSPACEATNNHRSVCNDLSHENKYGGSNASGNMKVNLPSHEVKQGPTKQASLVSTSNDLSLSNAKFGSEVTQSRLLEMVSRNNTLVQGISMKHTDGSNPITSIQMMHPETKNDGDTHCFTRETSDASKLLCSPDESIPVVSRPNTSLNNHQFRPVTFQASQATVGHGYPIQKPNSLGGLLPGKMLGLHHRGSNPSTNAPVFVNSSLTSTGPSIKRDDPTMQAWMQTQNARLADADAALRNGMRVIPSPQIEQSELQTRDYSAIARLMPKEIQVDIQSQALSQFNQLHSQNTTKLSNSTSNPGPVVESFGPKTMTPYVQIPLALESSKSHMQSWRGLPLQFRPEKEKALNLSPSKPPDLNVELQKPNSPGRQSSGMLTESQQPDLALQL